MCMLHYKMISTWSLIYVIAEENKLLKETETEKMFLKNQTWIVYNLIVSKP